MLTLVTASRVSEPNANGDDDAAIASGLSGLSLEKYPNPVKQLRMHYKMTQESFAKRVGMSRMALLRFEQALPPEPSYKFYIHIPEAGASEGTKGIKANPFMQKIHELYADAPFTHPANSSSHPTRLADTDVPVVWKEFVQAYYAYQRAKRIANYGVLDTNPLFSHSNLHPLIEWINQSESKPTITEVCVSFCAHLPTMHKFVNGPAYPMDVPGEFIIALKGAGYSPAVVMDFVTAYHERRNTLPNIKSPKTAL